MAEPSTEPNVINDRLDMVEFFVDRSLPREDLRTHLKSIPDMVRALSRLSLGRGGPRDIAAICDGLRFSMRIRQGLCGNADLGLPPGLLSLCNDLGEHSFLVDELTSALATDLPLLARDGGFIGQIWTS